MQFGWLLACLEVVVVGDFIALLHRIFTILG